MKREENKQMSFLTEEVTQQRKKRVEKGFRETSSKDGSYSPHIPSDVAIEFKQYCKYLKKSCIECIVEAINEWIEKQKREIVRKSLADIPREELEKFYFEHKWREVNGK